MRRMQSGFIRIAAEAVCFRRFFNVQPVCVFSMDDSLKKHDSAAIGAQNSLKKQKWDAVIDAAGTAFRKKER